MPIYRVRKCGVYHGGEITRLQAAVETAQQLPAGGVVQVVDVTGDADVVVWTRPDKGESHV
jgi:uncharacterized protein YcgI (DUF1989 family)